MFQFGYSIKLKKNYFFIFFSAGIRITVLKNVIAAPNKNAAPGKYMADVLELK